MMFKSPLVPALRLHPALKPTRLPFPHTFSVPTHWPRGYQDSSSRKRVSENRTVTRVNPSKWGFERQPPALLPLHDAISLWAWENLLWCYQRNSALSFSRDVELISQKGTLTGASNYLRALWSMFGHKCSSIKPDSWCLVGIVGLLTIEPLEFML